MTVYETSNKNLVIVLQKTEEAWEKHVDTENNFINARDFVTEVLNSRGQAEESFAIDMYQSKSECFLFVTFSKTDISPVFVFHDIDAVFDASRMISRAVESDLICMNDGYYLVLKEDNPFLENELSEFCSCVLKIEGYDVYLKEHGTEVIHMDALKKLRV